MRLPGWLARFNKHVTNRVSGLIAPNVRPLATVIHRGRRSGAEYRTTIMCWVEQDAVTVALTYGPNVDWLKNLVAAGGGEMLYNGQSIEIGPPRIIDTAAGLRRLPALVASALRLIRLEDFVVMPVLAVKARDRG